MNRRFDKIDHQILAILTHNGRMTNFELASRVNLSPTPCLRRVRALEELGIIAGYAAVVDHKKIGLELTVFVEVRLSDHSQPTVQAFERLVTSHEEIVDCHLMAGDSDYLLHVIAKNMMDYEAFVRNTIHQSGLVATVSSNFAYGTIKSRFLPVPK